jgi:hypothetical protein
MLYGQYTVWAVLILSALSDYSAENMGFFMTFNYFSQLKVKAIWNEINRLLAALRPHSRRLVDGFGIPDKVNIASL